MKKASFLDPEMLLMSVVLPIHCTLQLFQGICELWSSKTYYGGWIGSRLAQTIPVGLQVSTFKISDRAFCVFFPSKYIHMFWLLCMSAWRSPNLGGARFGLLGVDLVGNVDVCTCQCSDPRCAKSLPQCVLRRAHLLTDRSCWLLATPPQPPLFLYNTLQPLTCAANDGRISAFVVRRIF